MNWELAFAPYDTATYAAALGFLRPEDMVLDIGAGDLRFARQSAGRVRQVVAVEINPVLLASPADLPANVHTVCADARDWPFPAGVTVGVLLMRHCAHFALYVQKLRAVGCTRLITNARWGMDVECVDLNVTLPYGHAPDGWFACLCGQVGFKAQTVSPDTVAINRVSQLARCPACFSH